MDTKQALEFVNRILREVIEPQGHFSEASLQIKAAKVLSQLYEIILEEKGTSTCEEAKIVKAAIDYTIALKSEIQQTGKDLSKETILKIWKMKEDEKLRMEMYRGRC